MIRMVLIVILCGGLTGNLFAGDLPAGFAEQLIASNLDPTDLALTPDGRIFITMKSGKIRIIEAGVLRAAPLIDFGSKVDYYNERGLGHILLDPDFTTNGFYYVYYTVAGANRNRVSRFTAIGNFSDTASEVVLLDLDEMPGTIHNGGDLAWGIDGKLYIAVGDGANGGAVQSLTTKLGKVLRINKDGSIPEDNPFYNQTTGTNRAIWALGFRNPFSLNIQPGTGKVFLSDVGNSAWEEINEVISGANYGWPLIEGKRTNQTLPSIGTYKDPHYAYAHGGGANEGCAIVGASFYNPTVVQFPATYVGRFFFADYCNGYIKTIDPNNGTDVQTFATGINRPLAVIVADDGSLYYLARAGIGGGSDDDNTSTDQGTLWHVTYSGSGAPAVSVNPQPTLVTVGEEAQFTVKASGLKPLTYQWLVNNVEVSGATLETFTFTNAQITDDGKLISCRVSNTAGNATSANALLTVTTNTRPVPTITLNIPAEGVLYKAGQVISATGTATDAENGTIPGIQLSWKIDFHHNEHTHPAATESGSGSLLYVIPKVGETSDNVWYRVYLTATDNGTPALSKTIHKDIFPSKTVIHLETNPPGLKVILDGQPVTTPYTFTSVKNITRNLDAPVTQFEGESYYLFQSWSEGTEQEFNFDTPETEKTFTATFVSTPIGDGEGLTGFYFTAQDQTFNGQATLVRLDPVIDFTWGGGSPDPLISADKFTVKWLGEIQTLLDDEYTFYLKGDDGIRMWVGGEQIINAWVDQAATTYNGKKTLAANTKYPVRIEYYENGGDATIELQWSSNHFDKQLIPTSQLSSDVITGIEPDVNQWWIYPTVVTENLILHRLGSGTSEWTIVGIHGQNIKRGEIKRETTIDVSDLVPGMYVIKVGNEIARFVKMN